MLKRIKNNCCLLLVAITVLGFQTVSLHASTTYFVNSAIGNDANDGLSVVSSWKSIAKLQQINLQPGDSVLFARGSSFDVPFYVNGSGSASNPIVITDYGLEELQAPAFTNKVFEQDNFGNCIRILGSYVIVENLYFHETTTYVDGNYETNGGWPVWQMGALYIDMGAEHCIIRNNEFFDCPAAIRSYGEYALITNNYIHDCNRVMKEWTWGPLGIWFGADNQEASYNRIFNYRAEHPNIQWANNEDGGGADGGAFEVDDARFPKSNIHIHHNYTRDCQGFLEVTWTDVLQNPDYIGFHIHHNISDDYQAFTAVWRGREFRIENNTIVRRKVNSNDWGVFNITGQGTQNRIINNIIVTEQNIPIFNTGIQFSSSPANIIENNLYFAAVGQIKLGKEGPGKNLVQGNPLFKNYERLQEPEDFAITLGSPAINKGKELGYSLDFFNNPIPVDNNPDIGAIEFSGVLGVAVDENHRFLIRSVGNNTLLIDNKKDNKQAFVYDLKGTLLRQTNLIRNENRIEIPECQICIVQIDNGKAFVLRL